MSRPLSAQAILGVTARAVNQRRAELASLLAGVEGVGPPQVEVSGSVSGRSESRRTFRYKAMVSFAVLSMLAASAAAGGGALEDSRNLDVVHLVSLSCYLFSLSAAASHALDPRSRRRGRRGHNQSCERTRKRSNIQLAKNCRHFRLSRTQVSEGMNNPSAFGIVFAVPFGLSYALFSF